MKKKVFTPWSSLDNMMGRPPTWFPDEERQRIQAYEKYDQLYWNDPTQYAIRVLENEQPLYIPNARTIVDTTSYYLMKGLTVTAGSKADQDVLDSFLKRERFLSQFHIAKQSGVARGDWAFHITADPSKPEGERISCEAIHPGMVIKVPDEDDPSKTVRMHIVSQYTLPGDDTGKEYLRKLTYEKVMVAGKRRISREEAVYELFPEWWGPDPKKVKTLLKPGLLPEQIDQFPIYWYNNIEWQEQNYGSSELRGLEYLDWAVSQGSTDVEAALALEGLGVYATDGGRPVDDDGNEADWEVAPGKVMEVPSGSYFRRVEGVGSITPMMDQINYLESKMREATALSDVALGRVDVQTAQSGIALAIRFMPTLAKIEHRDTAGVEVTQNLFYDLSKWYEAYEGSGFTKDIEVSIAASKLPVDRTAKVNELNNMIDRGVISKQYYRDEMVKLGYKFPANMEDQITKEAQAASARNPVQPAPGQDSGAAPGAGTAPSTSANGANTDNVDNSGNQSNNRNRPNESSGTESGQNLATQTKS